MTQPINIYLAGRYSRRAELDGYRRELESRGYVVTSRWLDGQHQIPDDGMPVGGRADEYAERFALEDWEDLRRAEVVIAFTEAPRSTSSRGGRHVELGAALAWGKQVVIVGPRENVFCHLPEIAAHSDTWPGALEFLASCSALVEAARRRDGRKAGTIETLGQLLRRARTGEIDGAVIVTTRGREVAFTSWINVPRRALPEVSVALQGLNANAVSHWWEASAETNFEPKLHAVEDGPAT